jgi:hypothetical protein
MAAIRHFTSTGFKQKRMRKMWEKGFYLFFTEPEMADQKTTKE